MNNLNTIASQFLIEGTVNTIRPLGNGLINDTYRIATAEDGKPDYVLQRINHNIFTDVELLQHNIETVTDHNLTRARNQWHLFLKAKEHEAEMKQFICGL